MTEARVPDRERLSWVKPEWFVGISPDLFRATLLAHPQADTAKSASDKLDNLDPNQRVSLEVGRDRASQLQAGTHYARNHPPTNPTHMLLLGTAGTGETSTLGPLTRTWEEMGSGKILATASTGIATSKVGFGARTIHDMFHIGKTSPTSVELSALRAGGSSIPCLFLWRA